MIYWPQYGMRVQGQRSKAQEGNLLCLEVCCKTDAATLSRMNKGGRRDRQVTVSVYVSFAQQDNECVSAVFAGLC